MELGRLSPRDRFGAPLGGIGISLFFSLRFDEAAAKLLAAVEQVAVVGIRLGGMLAALAAARGARVQDLVLWGPASNGRGLLR